MAHRNLGIRADRNWQNSVVVRFGEIEVDVPRREVRRAGTMVHLEPQAFDLLVALLENRDRVLSKIELLDGVWGHRFVSEANLTTRIKEIRRAVGDDGARQHTIKNVRGRGYRFVANLELASPPAIIRVPLRLIGRDDETEALIAALADSPVVTLTGPGGVGKSTLARAAADLATKSYADGVRLVELATLESGDQVLPAIARALDIVLVSDGPDSAVRAIADVDVLLVLDNCEHVVDDVAALLDRVMAVGGARVRVLATSQVRLGLSVEQLLNVHPLTSSQAVELFTVRALAVSPTWDLDHAGPSRVATLLAGLDQLPLTIEMAAARLGSMTFDELESAIGDGMPMPVTHRSPARRHRSLDSLVTWSAELLEAPLRRTLTEFSVFAGAVAPADAAAVLASDPAAVVFDLASLAERSLLVAEVDGPTTRYRMLATVRAVAGHWLDESRASDDVRRRHAEHFADATRLVDRQIRTPGEAEGRRRLNSIVAEVRAAHRWAQRHEPKLASSMSGALHLAAYSTFWSEPAAWSRSLLAQYPDAAGDALYGARLVVAAEATNRGELDDARSAATAAVAAQDPTVRLTALEILADVAVYAGHLSEAALVTEQLRSLGEELGDSHAVAIAAVDAALALAYGGDASLALTHLDGVNLDAMSLSDRAWIMYARGEALSAGALPDATTTFIAAIELARTIGNPFVTSVARMSLAAEHARAGQLHQSLDAYSACLHEYVRHGNFVHAVTTLRNLVEMLVTLGDDRAAALLAAATSSQQLRPSYGPEVVRLSRVVAGIEQRVGASRFGAWTDEGRLLDLPQAVQMAADLIDRHRT